MRTTARCLGMMTLGAVLATGVAFGQTDRQNQNQNKDRDQNSARSGRQSQQDRMGQYGSQDKDLQTIAKQIKQGGTDLEKAIDAAQKRVSGGTVLAARVTTRESWMRSRQMGGQMGRTSGTLNDRNNNNNDRDNQYGNDRNRDRDNQYGNDRDNNRGIGADDDRNRFNQNDDNDRWFDDSDWTTAEQYRFNVLCIDQSNNLKMVVVDKDGNVKNVKSCDHRTAQHILEARPDRLASSMGGRDSWNDRDDNNRLGQNDRDNNNRYGQNDRQNRYGDNDRQANRSGRDNRDRDNNMSLRVVRLVSFDALDDTTVKNRSDQDLGEINDLAIDPSTGYVSYAVLESGGVLGMGEKKFAIPLSAMDVVTTDRVRLDKSKSYFENHKGFNQDQWPTRPDSEFASASRSRNDGTDHGSRMSGTDGTNSAAGQRITQIRKASEFVGMNVYDNSGNDIGEISDLYVDPDNDRVSFAVLSHGGVMGMGDELYAIPWDSMHINKDNVSINVPKSRIENGPKQKKNDKAGFEDPDWVVTVYRYYDVSPYWSR